MADARLPAETQMLARWRAERLLSLMAPAFRVLGVLFAVLLGLLWFLPMGIGGPIAVLITAFVALLLATCGVVLLSRRVPGSDSLAKRADYVLGLPDDLLVFSELDSGVHPEWDAAISKHARSCVEALDLEKAWPVRVPASTRNLGLGVGALFVMMICVAGWKFSTENRQLAVLESARDARIEVAEEMLQDWEAFVEITPDEELKKLFAESEALREALKQTDPMAAMMEINKIEEQMDSLQESISKESLSGMVGEMAEALEAFEGFGALSAALRHENFDAAAAEAEKLAAELSTNPGGETPLRRQAAVAEMLASQAKSAAQSGNEKLADALQKMSQAASQSAESGQAIANNQIAPSTKSMQTQFSQEAARQNRGRMVSLSKEQLEALRRNLRQAGKSQDNEGSDDSPGESPSPGEGGMPSLMAAMGDQPGGKMAGEGSGGEPRGDSTELASASSMQHVAGTIGEGESETRTLQAASGSGKAVAGGAAASFSEYAELSRKAVQDESLPLAHRRVIRSYFERIRPVAETADR